jgi:exonuclease I
MEWFFYWWSFAEFRLEKYDFDLYKGFFKEKNTQICQILKEKNSNLANLYDKF